MPLLPIAAVCACLWLMLNLTALTWIRFGIWLVAGTAIYVGYGRRHWRRAFGKLERARPGGVELASPRIYKLRYMSRHKTQTALLSNPNVVWLMRRFGI